VLVLTRNKGEAVKIGDDGLLTVIVTGPQRMKLLIEGGPTDEVIVIEQGETVEVLEDVRVMAMQTGTRQARVGFDAPEEIAILRTELLEGE